MTTQQLSIFMENKPGQLVKVTQTLKEAQIDIRAMSLADTKDFGIVRMIVSDTEKAQAAMREKGFMSTITKVMCIAMNDQPGGLSAITRVMADADVNIDYLYASYDRASAGPIIVIHADDMQELMYIYELRERLTVCRTVIAHLKARHETRWHCFAENSDYPERDDEKWKVFVNSRVVNGKTEIILRRVSAP